MKFKRAPKQMPMNEPNEVGPNMNDNEAAESPQMQQQEMQAPQQMPQQMPQRMPMKRQAPPQSGRRHYKSGGGWTGGR
jgi:hypothetical protein